MKMSMVVASSDAMACRVFIGCARTAEEFGVWLRASGWHVRIEPGVDPRTQPRIKEEEETAAVLVNTYELWRVTR